VIENFHAYSKSRLFTSWVLNPDLVPTSTSEKKFCPPTSSLTLRPTRRANVVSPPGFTLWKLLFRRSVCNKCMTHRRQKRPGTVNTTWAEYAILHEFKSDVISWVVLLWWRWLIWRSPLHKPSNAWNVHSTTTVPKRWYQHDPSNEYAFNTPRLRHLRELKTTTGGAYIAPSWHTFSLSLEIFNI